LSFGQDLDGYPTFTVTAAHIAQMIRFLAVSISEHYVITVTPVTHQPVDDTDPSDLVTDAI
jgi:hypothetical protein